MYYDTFVNALRSYTWYGSKYYYITAAPQYILSAKWLLNLSDVLIRMHTLATLWTLPISSITLKLSLLIYSMVFIQVSISIKSLITSSTTTIAMLARVISIMTYGNGGFTINPQPGGQNSTSVWLHLPMPQVQDISLQPNSPK